MFTIKTIINYVWNFFRYFINKNNKRKLINKNPTIISSNCNGTIILHDLGLKYLTPTINLFIEPKDFIKLAKNIERYISDDAPLVEVEIGTLYPVGEIFDIKIHFVHYHSFDEAKKKWKERCTRIDYNNLFFLMTDRDECTYEDMLEFDRLNYSKVIFTKNIYPEINSSYYIKGFEQDKSVGILTSKKDLFGKRILDDFDYVDFLNRGPKV